jgi:hypothetical protein
MDANLKKLEPKEILLSPKNNCKKLEDYSPLLLTPEEEKLMLLKPPPLLTLCPHKLLMKLLLF